MDQQVSNDLENVSLERSCFSLVFLFGLSFLLILWIATILICVIMRRMKLHGTSFVLHLNLDF
jgi:hypothetical protein